MTFDQQVKAVEILRELVENGQDFRAMDFPMGGTGKAGFTVTISPRNIRERASKFLDEIGATAP